MSESSQYAPSKKPLPGMATPSTPPLERRRRGRAARPAGPPSQHQHQHDDEPWANSWAHKRMHELFASQQPPQAAFAAQHPSFWMPPAPQQTLALVPGSTRRTSHEGHLIATSHTLTIEGAKRAMAGALAQAEACRWPVTVAIVDHSGALLLLERHGAAPITVDIAVGKARTAALSGRESAVFQHAVNGDATGGNPSRRPRLALLSAPSNVLMEGGVPILVGGTCIGAVGCAGVRSDQDSQVARGRAGVTALATAASFASAHASASSYAVATLG
jgi:glc operon protein GlcG